MDTTTLVLDFFLTSKSTIVSGQHLSEKLLISRNAVWKAIEQLRKNGYIIEGLTNKGYKLIKIPNQVDKYYLQSKLKKMCSEVIIEEKLLSTNTLLKTLADAEGKEKTVVIAKEQTRGRGRLGRAWESQKGGLWFSILFRPKLPMEQLSLITLTMAAALREGIYCYSNLDLKIKWPNDILYNNKKVSGILTEVKGDMDTVDYVVVGIGVNVNNFIPEEIGGKAVSLKKIIEKEININDLLVRIMEKIIYFYDQFIEGNISEILRINTGYSAIMGEKVEITSLKGPETGTVQGIADDGALLLKNKHGQIKKVVSGDVSLTSWY